MMDEAYKMWLYNIDGVGDMRIRLLISSLGSAQAVFEAPHSLLMRIAGLGQSVANNITKSQTRAALDKCEDWLLRDEDSSFVTLDDPKYPHLLRMTDKPPYGLFIKGKLPPDCKHVVAIVGSRRCTEYGRTVAYEFANELSRCGVIVISGLASGIDARAHKGALAHGNTIGVLGCGVDVVYPKENRGLFDEVRHSGCLVSNYAPDTEPRAAYFPARNRIISGLSNAVLVVEAAAKSGTLITVGHALDQGREVFAVPGSIKSRYSEGTNLLIKEGAAIATSPEDILAYLGAENLEPPEKKQPLLALSPDEKAILTFLDQEHTSTLEHILQRTNLDTPTANQALTMLELQGVVQRLPGLRFERVYSKRHLNP